jgi:hypothetical protein
MPPTATPAVVKVEITLGSFGRTLKAIKIEATPAQVDGSFMRAAIYSTIGFISFLLELKLMNFEMKLSHFLAAEFFQFTQIKHAQTRTPHCAEDRLNA